PKINLIYLRNFQHENLPILFITLNLYSCQYFMIQTIMPFLLKSIHPLWYMLLVLASADWENTTAKSKTTFDILGVIILSS
ncbi:MAG: hypothetical protein NC453_23015, partial [Muribaculum sp.]|nr:hypothetical protein [Muribaculum sp.]